VSSSANNSAAVIWRSRVRDPSRSGDLDLATSKVSGEIKARGILVGIPGIPQRSKNSPYDCSRRVAMALLARQFAREYSSLGSLRCFIFEKLLSGQESLIMCYFRNFKGNRV